MKREEFDRTLAEEGIKSKRLRDEFWKRRPADDLDEKKLRKAAKMFKREYHQIPFVWQ